MAVRNDFSAGETLTAQDLNDTFASKLPYSYGTATPSTSDSGFLWYDSNSTPAAPKFWDGSTFLDFPSGLSLVTTETFSAVSSVSINGCFTSTHQNYRLVITTQENNADLQMRLRSSGSDNSTSNYNRANGTINSSGSFANYGSGNSQTFWFLANTNGKAGIAADLFSPAEARETHLHAQGRNFTSTFLISGSEEQQSSFDGFTLYPASGTISGTIRVYGYKD